MTFTSHPVLDTLNKFLGMGLTLREALPMTDAAFRMKPGTARQILLGNDL